MPGDRPERGVSVEVQDECVDDLVGPVHQPEGESGQHRGPVGPFDLDRVHVDRQREQRDRGPLELPVGAEQVLGLAGIERNARQLSPARRGS